LLHIIGLLDRPNHGRYELDGKDMTLQDDETLAQIRRDKIGFVFQAFHLIPRLSAFENVELPLILAGTTVTERRHRVEQSLRALGLSDRAHHRPDQLSGGERQRVAIARAMILKPRVLLADEPTGNLDRASGREVLTILEALNRDGLTLLVVTHDPEIGRRARRRLQLVDGRIVADLSQEQASATG
jgi:putative ABC transport system ATP-binding protein